MRLSDTMNGPAWIIWVVFAFFLIIGIVMLTGHGAGLIAGYNSSSPEEKAKYNEKKLCRVMGIGMLLYAAMILAVAIWGNALPSYTSYIFLGAFVAEAIILVILSKTICKK